MDNHNNSLFLVKFVIPQYSEQNPEETRPDETDEESDGLGTLKSKFPNLKISTSGKSGNGSRLTFTKAGTSNKGGESSKGNTLSEKKKSNATAGAGAGAEGALSPTSFFRTAGTATKGGDRKVILHLTFWRKIYALRTIIIGRLCQYYLLIMILVIAQICLFQKVGKVRAVLHGHHGDRRGGCAAPATHTVQTAYRGRSGDGGRR